MRDDGFAEFMARSQAELLRTAWLLVGDAHRAEELTQQALVRTYAAWPRAQRDPVACTRRVLVNLRTDTWRRRRREVLMSPERLPERGRAVHDGVEHRDQLSRALSLLTARQRKVVVLRYVLDLSETQVAADLGISVGTVKSTASRALGRC
ncbi:SigE family RNA polymerase sigma factor [Dermatophilaceae bacterium Soc4.6]